MGIVFREWRKDPTACAMLVGWFVVSVIYVTLNSVLVILISNTFSDPVYWYKHLMILILVCMTNAVLSMIRGWLRPRSIHHCFVHLNNLYCDKILDADPDMFTKYSCAYVNTMAEFIAKISSAGLEFMRFLLNIVNLTVIIFSIIMVGGAMAIPVIIIHAIGAVVAKILFHEYEKIDKDVQEIKKVRNQEVENIIYGFMEVRSFNTQGYHSKRIHKFNEDILDLMKKRSKIQVLTNLSFETIDAIGLVGVIIYSIRSMAAGVLVQAQAMSLVMYVLRVIEPISQIMDFVDTISDQVALADSYDKIVSYVNTCHPGGNIRMDTFNNAIELKDVSFAYEASSTILNKVNLTFPKGKKIGICGVSGSGKSTLFKLLNRFYDQKSGSILVDDIEVHFISKDSYRNLVGSVHQDNTIFPGTIWSNITYGNNDILEYDVLVACKKANIYEFIMSLPNKFNTIVGPRGLTLSGGQKQRIALARLFLRNPDIILLDEATSALDNESETFIQDAIDGLKGKTIITIAHRLSTIKNSDIIYVLGPSGVLEQGTHEELVEKHGAYYQMLK